MNLQQEEQEYHQMKDWLAGKKPPAQGRSWRRVAIAAVPHSWVEPLRKEGGESFLVATGLGVLALRVLAPLIFLHLGMGMMEMMFSSMANVGAAVGGPQIPIEQLFPVLQTITHVITGVILLSTLIQLIRGKA